MAGNSFGTIFRLTTFGESHGEAIGGIIDGCPAGLEIDFDFIGFEMERRKPGQSAIVSPRKESDEVNFLSGIFEGKTTGTPIGFIIKNEDQRTQDYKHVENIYRPSHADFVYDKKYGVRDYRGSGRASARETACRVAAGAIAKLILKKSGVKISAYTSQVDDISVEKNYSELDLSAIDSNMVRCPDAAIAEKMIERIEEIRTAGDTIGGVITCVAQNVPAGLGEPVFDKLHADLGKAMLSINAVKGFETGSGFEGTKLKGSQHNDRMVSEASSRFATNFSGGIQGGISNGADIYFRIAFKPVSTIMKAQTTINAQGEGVEFTGKGRHDPCVLPRAVPVVEAMTALVLADHLLRNKTAAI